MHPSHISVRITCLTQEGLERGVQLVPTKFPTKDYNHIPMECAGMKEVTLAAKRRQGGTQQVLPTVAEKITSDIHNASSFLAWNDLHVSAAGVSNTCSFVFYIA